MGDEAALVESDRVLGVSTNALGFKPNLQVEANETANLLTLTVRANDPDDAALAATQLGEIYRRTQTSVAASVASPAVANPDPVAPSQIAHILIGSLIGAALGALALLGIGLRSRLPQSNQSDELELEFHKPEPIRPARQPSQMSHELAEVVAGPNDQAAREAARRKAAEHKPEPARAAGATDDMPAAADATIDLTVDSTAGARSNSPVVDLGTSSGLSARPDQSVAHVVDGASTVDDATLDDHPASPANPKVRSAPESGAFAGALSTPVTTATTVTTSTPGATLPRRSIEPDAPESSTDDHDPNDRFLGEVVDAAVTSDTDDISDGHDAARLSGTTDRLAPHKPTFADAAGADPAVHTRDTDQPSASRRLEEDMASVEDITTAVETAMAAADSRLETRLSEQRSVDAQKLASIEAHYQRQIDALKREVSEARKRSRAAVARLKKLDGNDQHRIGDLEAQAQALEAEISSLRSQLEAERIDHLREIAKERDAADNSLDNARREYRRKIEIHDADSRSSLARSRAELDDVLADARAEHEAALDRQHQEYEDTLAAERDRRSRDLAKLTDRHREELAAATKRASTAEEQIKRQTKDTLARLRQAEKDLTDEVTELRKAEGTYRAELVQVRAQLRQNSQLATESEQVLQDELATSRKALQIEKDRNAALREDVVRRTAEAHQAVDRAIDERSAQLAELEALMARQRDHAEQRIREANDGAETRVREASERELELQTRVKKLERKLAENSAASSSQTA